MNRDSAPQNSTIRSELVLSKASDYFEDLLQGIRSAVESIDLETYIFEEDEIGMAVGKALCEASERGVRVRVLIDGFGSPVWGRKLADQFEKSGVEYKIYHPLPWAIWHWGRSTFKADWILEALHRFLGLNQRNHRKSCNIDGKKVWLGSFNISKNHELWRDTAVKVEGLSLEPLKIAFDYAWDPSFQTGKLLKKTFGHSIRLNAIAYLRRKLRKDLVSKINVAKNRVWITNAYFVPTPSLIKALRNAAKKKVDVKIIIPRYSDVFFIPWAASVFYETLLEAGAEIYEYETGMLHTKTVLIDQFATIGSSNLNQRSWFHDLEVDVEIRLNQSIQKLEADFLTDLNGSKKVDALTKPRWSITRFFGRLLLIMKYWL